MGEDLVQQLNQLQAYAGGLQGLIEDANGQLPQRVEGADPTGAVRVVLGADGLPVSFDIEYEWNRKVRPEALGRAVEQAVKAASDERLAAWAQAFAGADWDRPDRAADMSVAPAVAPAPSGPTDVRTGRRRDVSELVQEMLDATNNLDALTAAASAEGVGATAFGRIELRLASTGLVSCAADQFWVSDKNGQQLTEALSQALAAAREDLARARKAGPAGRVAGILDDALAILHDPNRVAGP